MPKSLVIVESPTKAKTIKKFLPKDFQVEASMGHVRDLPDSAADIPKEFKDQEWAKIGVNVDQDFSPLYVVPKQKSKVIAELKRKLKEADRLYLATDEDREGESIAWHLREILKPKVPTQRMVFGEITKSAIEKSLKSTRAIDEDLVRAQETRRILDRLVGYSLSPLIWKKIAFGLSAGRVQSVALKLLVVREKERSVFRQATYWDLLSQLQSQGEIFPAKLQSVGGKRVATGKDFDEATGLLVAGKKDVLLLGEADARELAKKLKADSWVVESLQERPVVSRPSAPFITSTLQQEANRKLGMSSKQAMRTAQRLYEEGFITYMRTDSPALSTEALQAARDVVTDLYGKDHLSPEPRQFTAKAKGAQEAHEAIRPAGSVFQHPKESGLSGDEARLYELIWKRTVASQMAEARKMSLSAAIRAGDCEFVASGTRIVFAGFLRAYVEGSDDPEAALEDKEVLLPKLTEKQTLKLVEIEAQDHETKPPARFTEASLVQMLEKEGIGRPSTYASIIGTIVDRGYVRKVASALVPTFTGMAVVQLLQKHFTELVDTGFTSKMESSLDDIAAGKQDWLGFLKSFFLGKTGLRSQITAQEKAIDPDQARSVDLPQLKEFEVRIGRFGPYLVKAGSKKLKTEELRASIPEDVAPADLSSAGAAEILEVSARGPQPIGKHSKTGEFIYCLTGRFGPYVQLGEVSESQPKPKRASLPKGLSPSAVTMELAEKWLALPRELGLHPTSQKPIVANNGRFGPYIVCDGDFRSLKKDDDVYTVTLDRALELLKEEKKGRGGSQLLKELGKHPKDEKPISAFTGRYGPYVKWGSVNATIPKDLDPNTLTLEKAVELLSARSPKAKAGRRTKSSA
jgi:DNA topoisomerase-1